MSDTLPRPESSHLGWADWEDALIRADYRRGRAGYIAATLGRSVPAVQDRARRLQVTGNRSVAPGRKGETPPALPTAPAPPLANPAVVVELVEARMEADALRVLLAPSQVMLTDDEAGQALGVSSDPPQTVNGRPPSAVSPLRLHLAEQAARGMDLASKRLGRGGVLGVSEAGRFTAGGGRA